MADKVTFSTADSDLMTGALGVYRFTPGMMTRDWVFVRMPRGIGEIAKDLGLNGCDHTLMLKYLNVSVGSIAGIFNNLQDLWTPDSGSPRSGTLTVPDYGTYPHCVVTDCTPDEQTVRVIGLSPSNLNGTKAYDLGFTLTFHQLRR